MKKIAIFIIVVAIFACTKKPSSITETKKIDEPQGVKPKDTLANKPETFSYKEGDTTYVMQKYFMVFLKKGPNRDQDSLTSATIQKKHMAHLEKLHLDGKICIAGPFADDGSISGMVVFNTATFKEADSLAKNDPAVKAGRLIVETHPFWAAKGSALK